MIKKIGILLCVLTLTACAKKAAQTDFDPSFNFADINSVQVTIVENDSELSANNVSRIVKQQLQQRQIPLDENAESLLRISAFIEDRANDQALNIGLGTGTGSRHSNISIGTSVRIPLGEDTVQWQVIQLDLIHLNQVVWTSTDDAKIKIRDGKGLNQVQQEIVERIFENFPLPASAEKESS